MNTHKLVLALFLALMNLLKVFFSMKVVFLLLLLVESIEVGCDDNDEPCVDWKESLRQHRRLGRARLTTEVLEKHHYARRLKLQEMLTTSSTLSEATKQLILAELNLSEEDVARRHQEQLQHLAYDVFDHLDFELSVK